MNHVQTAIERARERWQDRRVVVVGAGCSGIAAARLLLECGADVTLTDARPADEIPAAEEIAARGARLVAGSHPDEIWRGADIAVFSPGIRPDAPVSVQARAAGVEIVAEIEVAGTLVQAPVIAITGSNGKSTVTAMVGAIFAAAGLDAPVCGNIGTALSDAARAEIIDGERPYAYVVEISSFQARGIREFRPRLAALLNIQPDHVDWHGTFEAYADAKLRLVRNMAAGDQVVYNRDDPELVSRLPHSEATWIPFAYAPQAHDIEPPSAWVGDGQIWWWPAASSNAIALIGVGELGVIGPHNHANACAATALAASAGLEPEAIVRGLTSYRPLEHRMERCGEVNGVVCINDSKATNIDATLAALSGFDRGVWLILGGRDKGADFRQLVPMLDRRVAGILLIGEAADAIATALEPSREVRRCETLETAVAQALGAAAPGDTLLLSPACTSFDQYPNFEERGRHFKELVAARAAGTRGAADPVPEVP